MFPAAEELPDTAEGWILTGKATKAEVESPVPPPPPPTPALAPNGKSPPKLEKRGGRLLKRFGVRSDRPTGVVRDSRFVPA